jgi:hypothetical protein
LDTLQVQMIIGRSSSGSVVRIAIAGDVVVTKKVDPALYVALP